MLGPGRKLAPCNADAYTQSGRSSSADRLDFLLRSRYLRMYSRRLAFTSGRCLYSRAFALFSGVRWRSRYLRMYSRMYSRCFAFTSGRLSYSRWYSRYLRWSLGWLIVLSLKEIAACPQIGSLQTRKSLSVVGCPQFQHFLTPPPTSAILMIRRTDYLNGTTIDESNELIDSSPVLLCRRVCG